MNINQFLILGKNYNSKEEVKQAQHDLIWFSYRSGFLHQNHISSDAGWGCMLRSGQMIFANGIQRHILENPNKQVDNNLKNIHDINMFIVKQFIDLENQPFSIQQIAALALEEFKLEMGIWYSPNRIAYPLKKLLNQSQLSQSLQLSSEVMYSDRPLYFSQCVTAMTGEQIDLSLPKNVLADEQKEYKCQQSLLLLIICQIGLDSPEEQYLNVLIKLVNHQTSIGMIGGRHSSGYYFIGMDNNELVFLDPHIVQKADVDIKQINLDTYVQKNIKAINKNALGPSVGVGFYIKDIKALNGLWRDLLEIQNQYPDDFFLMIEKEQNSVFQEAELVEEEDFFVVD